MNIQEMLHSHFSKEASAEVEEEATEKTAAEQYEEGMREAFIKHANDRGVNLADYSDADVDQSYAQFKEAAEEEADKDEKTEKLKEKAKEEHEEKKASFNKIAEADMMGRHMAVAFRDQWAIMDKEAADKTAAGDMKRNAAIAAQAAKENASFVGKHTQPAENAATTIGRGRVGQALHNASKWGKKNPGKAGLAAAGLALAGGGAAALASGRKKESSALDQLAAIEAVKIAGEAGYDVEEAIRKIAAVVELSDGNTSMKVASTATLDEATNIRAYELLEAVGVPVNWPG